MEVRIRLATPGDADALAAVTVGSWRAAYAGLIPDDFLAGLDVSARATRWREILASGVAVTLAAETADRIVGYVSVGRQEAADSATGVLYAIYVEPSHWGRGIGHVLHEAGLQRLRDEGCTGVELWVLRGNERAISFYARHGWTRDGREQVDDYFAGIELNEIGFHRPL